MSVSTQRPGAAEAEAAGLQSGSQWNQPGGCRPRRPALSYLCADSEPRLTSRAFVSSTDEEKRASAKAGTPALQVFLAADSGGLPSSGSLSGRFSTETRTQGFGSNTFSFWTKERWTKLFCPKLSLNVPKEKKQKTIVFQKETFAARNIIFPEHPVLTLMEKRTR